MEVKKSTSNSAKLGLGDPKLTGHASGKPQKRASGPDCSVFSSFSLAYAGSSENFLVDGDDQVLLPRLTDCSTIIGANELLPLHEPIALARGFSQSDDRSNLYVTIWSIFLLAVELKCKIYLQKSGFSWISL